MYHAPPVSAEPCPLDLSGDCGCDMFRLEPAAVDYGSFDSARASLEDIEGFTSLLEEEHPDYGTLFYGEAGEEPYLFFITSEGIRYRLHLPATSQGTLPALRDWSEDSKAAASTIRAAFSTFLSNTQLFSVKSRVL